jgi:putative MATE family efflux protein
MKIFHFFRERNPTKGSIVRESIIMTSYLWPNTMFWILVHALNLFWLSRISIEAIAAVAIGSTALMILMTPIRGIVTSTYKIVGGFNRENPIGLEKRVKQILSATWLISIILAGVGYYLGPPLLQILGTESEITSLAMVYLRIQAIGGIIAFSFWPINEMMRATRNMAYPLILMAIVLVFQGLFDYTFILGNFGFPQMGVAGASLSRALSGAMGAGIGFWWLCRGKSLIKLNLRNWQDFKVKPETFKEIMIIAGFDTIQGFCRQATQMIMLGIVAPFGTLALGAYEIGHRFFRYCSMFGMDLGKTTAIGVSNNLGVGKIKRAEKWGWVNIGIITVSMGLAGFLIFTFASQVVEIFSQNSEVIKIGTSYFKITSLAGLSYIFFAGGIILQRVFGGAGDTRTPMVVYFLMMVLQIGLALVLPKFFGLGINGVWIAIFSGMIFYGAVMLILFKIGYWKPKH